ncbi:MAG: DUF2238 domain-containing protein [Clostridia bacterium]|nr:DUF2238 domain-containing protein [Clostridia bacterium]
MTDLKMLSRRFYPMLRAALPPVLRLVSVVLFFYFCARYWAAPSPALLLKLLQSAAAFALTFLPKLLHLENTRSAPLFYIFLFAACVAGSLGELYEKFTFYDVAVHLLSGVFLAVLAADLVQKSGLPLQKKQYFFFALLLTACAAALWEMYEFVAFTALKNTTLAAQNFLAQLGLAPAQQTAAALQSHMELSLHNVNALVQNEYDTFCDILCALVTGALTAGFVAKKSRRV